MGVRIPRGTPIQFLSSVVEQYLDMVKVTGSIPVGTTSYALVAQGESGVLIRRRSVVQNHARVPIANKSIHFEIKAFFCIIDTC